MKKILYALIFLAQTAVSQNIKISWSEESKSDLAFYDIVKGANKDFVKLCFDFKGKNLTPILTRYDQKLSIIKEENFLVNQDGIKFDRFLSVKNSLFLFTNYYDKSTKSTSFYSQALDIESLKSKGENINLGSFSSLKNSIQSDADFILSKDSSKILMLVTSPFEKNETEKYHMTVYDSKMKSLWSKMVELPYKDKYVLILGRMITNDGSVGVLLKHYDQEIVKEKVKVEGNTVPAYKTKLLLYSKDSANPKEYVIDMGGKFISSLSLCKEVGDKITLFGLYQNKSDGFITGFFTTTLNKISGNVTVVNSSEFPEGLVTLIENDKQGSDNKKDPGLSRNFTFKEAIERDNGDTDYLLQYNFETWVRTSSGSSYIVYYYGDIIDISIKEKDNKIVIARIPKFQALGSSTYGNFKALTHKDQLLLFYNDVTDNVDKDLSKKPEMLSGLKKPDLIMAKIDKDGNLTRKVLISNKDFKSTVAINSSVRVDNNKIGLYANKYGLFSSSKDIVGVLEIEK